MLVKVNKMFCRSATRKAEITLMAILCRNSAERSIEDHVHPRVGFKVPLLFSLERLSLFRRLRDGFPIEHLLFS